MTPDGGRSGPRVVDAPSPAPDLQARVDAERAGAAYWRDVAGQRRREAAAIQHRPLVRAAVALDRRTRRVQQSVAGGVDEVRRAARRATVVVDGWRDGADPATRRRAIDARAGAVLPRPDPREVLVLRVGPAPGPDGSSRPLTTAPLAHPGLAAGRLTPAAASAIDERVRTSAAPLVCLLGPGASPWAPTWLDHLTTPIATGEGPADPGSYPEVVATVPLTVHPARPWRAATAHDLLVRAAGLDLRVGVDGVPVVRARAAGEAPGTVDTPTAPVAATAAGFTCSRRAWLDAGGLRAGDGDDVDLDVAVVDLCLRLHDRGGRLQLVPAAVLTDARPVARRSDLDGPVDDHGPSWRGVVEARGPALVRRATGSPPDAATGAPTVALTTATPSAKIAAHSGDWHFAQDLARALRRAGHRVRVQTHAEADALAGRACDVHLVLRGLEPVRATAGQRHVLWIISHPEAVDVEECDRADLVLVASDRYAAHLRTLTATPVEVLLQATDHHRFRPLPVDPAHQHALTVVAGTRGVPRAAVTDALAAGLAPTVYGPGWAGRIPPSDWAAEYVDNDLLPLVYSSAAVVLNDHWETMRRWGFVSNRIFDVLACATPVVSDHLPELEALFGDLVPTWSSPDELAEVVADLRADPAGTAGRTAAARRTVLDAHTFDHRVAELTAHLRHHGLGIREKVLS